MPWEKRNGGRAKFHYPNKPTGKTPWTDPVSMEKTYQKKAQGDLQRKRRQRNIRRDVQEQGGKVKKESSGENNWRRGKN